MKKSKTYVVYETTNLITNHKYIGCFSYTDDARGKYYFTHYIGHGITNQSQAQLMQTDGRADAFVDAVVEHGIDNFIRRDLHSTDNEDEAYDMEERICDEKWVNREDTLNRRTGGKNGKWSRISKKQKSEKTKGELNPRAKKVINHLTGDIIGCIKEAAELYNINYSTLRKQLQKGKHPFLTYSESPILTQNIA